ncbi:YybH family protein [Cyclobacterium jeungdonense]|uniref:SgcJ/EcaC family oxidoreductase n=1 Tax=Cyclobacterium jeungdonense TaxID=708087 RepID=A0ABT8CEJ8_9BACT|nr:SgcJ/EcaC family oxidoreductase [Cyclobacterium jeungdonense]MDN3690013.1 SgcJ/EcaC family oxidoreductase [Cyclobacterium jeungdonense]
MKLPVILITILLISMMSCKPELNHSEEQDIMEITAMSHARADAFNAGDAAAIAVHFTTNAVLMAPNSPKEIGLEAVEAYYQGIFDAYRTGLESGYEAVRVDGDLAFGRGFAKVTLVSKTTGDTTYSTSKYLNILERQPDGSWKTTHDIWNANE